MVRYILGRIGLMGTTLLGVSVVVFGLLQLTPGDPASSLLGPLASPDDRVQLTRELGLDRALPIRYGKWLGNVLTGDFGESIGKRRGAAGLVLESFKNTAVLATFAGVAALVLGTVLGALGADARSRRARAAASAAAAVSVSVPPYSLGIILVAAIAIPTGWFPVSGMKDAVGGGGLGDLLHHVALPGIAAMVVPLGMIARMFRASYSEVLSRGLVENLRARGYSERRIRVHAFHNTLPSLLTVAGLQFGYLLGGTLLIEVVFSWPGLGFRVFEAISQRDYPVVLAGVMIAAVAFVTVNLVVDVLHALIDPRLRH